ncbi:MAG: hypothetical protein ACXWUG_32040, partial [Polyangiales bacterium]
MTTLTQRALAETPLLDAEQQDAAHSIGQLLYENGDVSAALDVFRLVALCAPMRARSWYSIAACHEVLGDGEHAAKLYRLAVDVARDEDYASLAGIRGALIACNEGDFESAEAFLDRL